MQLYRILQLPSFCFLLYSITHFLAVFTRVSDLVHGWVTQLLTRLLKCMAHVPTNTGKVCTDYFPRWNLHKQLVWTGCFWWCTAINSVLNRLGLRSWTGDSSVGKLFRINLSRVVFLQSERTTLKCWTYILISVHWRYTNHQLTSIQIQTYRMSQLASFMVVASVPTSVGLELLVGVSSFDKLSFLDCMCFKAVLGVFGTALFPRHLWFKHKTLQNSVQSVQTTFAPVIL